MKKAVIINSELMDSVTKNARLSPRSRMNHNFHKLDDTVNRMLNAIEPDSYIQPHRHLFPPQDEAFIVLRGRGAVFLFTDEGTVEHIVPLCSRSLSLGTDIPPGWFHTIVSLESGSIFYEVKAGPYDPHRLKDFASWAPPEGTSEAESYLTSLKNLIEVSINSD